MSRRVRPAATAGVPTGPPSAALSSAALSSSAVVLAVVLSAGCHAANEGVVDYRYFPPPDAGALRLAQTLGGLHVSPDAPHLGGPLAAGTAQLQRAERKYSAALTPADAATVVRPGEGFAVTLQQAFVSDFGEGGLTAADLLDERGEIAVVAGVRELTGPEALLTPAGLAPAAADRPTAGRVVFYSGDVTGRSALSPTDGGQYLNFSAVPLHVAADYAGGPVEISLSVLELDGEERDRRRELLGTLAAFGDRAYPPGSPVLAVLDELGAALLASVPDESVEFRYTCVLHPDRSGDPLPQARLREGNYVFVKQDHRRLPPPLRAARDAAAALGGAGPHPGPTAPVDWDAVLFDPLQGRLMAPDAAGDRLRFYRRHTYLTLQVRRTAAVPDPFCRPGVAGGAADLPSAGPGVPPVAVGANGGSTLPVWTRLTPPDELLPPASPAAGLIGPRD